MVLELDNGPGLSFVRTTLITRHNFSFELDSCDLK